MVVVGPGLVELVELVAGVVDVGGVADPLQAATRVRSKAAATALDNRLIAAESGTR
jgi:hypothetical protein